MIPKKIPVWPFETTLDSIDLGVAMADPITDVLTYENKSFQTLFEGEGGTLAERLPNFDKAKALKRMKRGRPYIFETTSGTGARAIPLEVRVRFEERDGRSFTLVQCRDLSKQKQVEYMLDSYSKLSEKNARDAKKEKERVEKLLLNIMPRTVYQEMKDFGVTTPQKFESATVLMLDFVGFTSMSVSRDPETLIAELNDIFTAFDRIVEIFDCERIKTIGDAYMAVSGIPEPNTDHASNIAKAALRMRRYLERRNESHEIKWRARFGIATGPAIGSVVGIQKYLYDIFGPAVNLSTRLEAHSGPMQITLSEETCKRIEGDFTVKALGSHPIKGFGSQALFELCGEEHNMLKQESREGTSLADRVNSLQGQSLS